MHERRAACTDTKDHKSYVCDGRGEGVWQDGKRVSGMATARTFCRHERVAAGWLPDLVFDAAIVRSGCEPGKLPAGDVPRSLMV